MKKIYIFKPGKGEWGLNGTPLTVDDIYQINPPSNESPGLQPGDNISELVNDAGYITSGEILVNDLNSTTQVGNFSDREIVIQGARFTGGFGQKLSIGENAVFAPFNQGQATVNIGYRAGGLGAYNTFLGTNAGYGTNSSYATGFGASSLDSAVPLFGHMTAYGFQSGKSNTGGNVLFLGYQAGTDNMFNDITIISSTTLPPKATSDNQFVISGSNNSAIRFNTNITNNADRLFNFPDRDGTLALLDDITEAQDLQSVLETGSEASGIQTPIIIQSANNVDVKGAIQLNSDGVDISGQAGGVNINGNNGIGIQYSASNGSILANNQSDVYISGDNINAKGYLEIRSTGVRLNSNESVVLTRNSDLIGLEPNGINIQTNGQINLSSNSNEIFINNPLPLDNTVTKGIAKSDSGGLVEFDIPSGSGGGATNLTYTATATSGTVNSDTGTDAVIPLASATVAGLVSNASQTIAGLKTLTNGIMTPFIYNNVNASRGTLYMGSNTMPMYFSRGTPDAIAVLNIENSVNTSTGNLINFSSNMGGGNAIRASVTKAGNYVTPNATASNHAPNLGQVEGLLANKADLVDGKVPLVQINDALIGSVNYQGNYNASNNTPALPSAVGNKGKYYVVQTAGTQQGLTLVGGDWIISNGVIWEKVDNNNNVTSVAGKVGAVTLVKGDVGLGNVDNTSDADKPISNATQIALSLKEPIITKNTAFNSNFGIGNTEVPRGNSVVLRGGGVGMGDNIVRIGWDNIEDLLVQVDGVPLGKMALKSFVNDGLNLKANLSGGNNFNGSQVINGNLEVSKIKLMPFLENLGGWIDMPTDFVSGIGDGGAGVNVWIARANENGQFFSNVIAGDLAYRNTSGRLLFGTVADVPAQLILDNTGLKATQPVSASNATASNHLIPLGQISQVVNLTANTPTVLELSAMKTFIVSSPERNEVRLPKASEHTGKEIIAIAAGIGTETISLNSYDGVSYDFIYKDEPRFAGNGYRAHVFSNGTYWIIFDTETN